MLSPNENEEAYIEGCDDGQLNKKTGNSKAFPKKYSGEKQHWYVQGYWDGYRDGGAHDFLRFAHHGRGGRAMAFPPLVTQHRLIQSKIIQQGVVQLSVMARSVASRWRRDQRARVKQ